MDKDSKQYKKIFNNKKLSWEDKLNKCSEYANQEVINCIESKEMFRICFSCGILPINLN